VTPLCCLLDFLIPASKRDVRELQRKVEMQMTTQAELVETVAAVQEQVAKIGTETSGLIDKVAELEAIIEAEGNASPELVAAVEALKAQVQVVDDLVADAPAEEPDFEEEG
jgi:uncharacterized protein YoxC